VILVLRLLHIVLGAFWVGAILLNALFLEPATRAAGPAAMPVMQELMKRRLLFWLPVTAIITLLSGLALLWIQSDGFGPEWMGSRFGMAYSTGGTLAIVAFIIGYFVMRPAQLRLGVLGASMPQLSGPEKDAAAAEIARLRPRVTMSLRWVAALLTLAVAFMAGARYL
jgi:uncharacterized membrane protein